MSDAPANSIVVPRPAATIVLVRDAADGPEVLMLRRASTAAFMPDAWVFPGGALDAADGSEAMLACCDCADDASVSARLGLAAGGRAWLVAAIRECFEECGLLLANDAAGRAATPATAGDLHAWRRDVLARPMALAELCARVAARLACRELAYWAHWITPESQPRRFDTRFFVAAAPDGQEPCLSGTELQALQWIAPRRALECGRAGELTLRRATQVTLEELAPFATTGELLEAAHAPREIVTRPGVRPALPPGR